jgi:hypothetical protein
MGYDSDASDAERAERRRNSVWPNSKRGVSGATAKELEQRIDSDGERSAAAYAKGFSIPQSDRYKAGVPTDGYPIGGPMISAEGVSVQHRMIDASEHKRLLADEVAAVHKRLDERGGNAHELARRFLSKPQFWVSVELAGPERAVDVWLEDLQGKVNEFNAQTREDNNRL